jgi:hypothetical protein
MPGEASFEIRLSEEMEPGVYANFLGVWHTGHEFTLDFAATQPPTSTDEGTVVPCRVVARVKIPPTRVFDIIKTLNANLTGYEETSGDIKSPNPKPDRRLPSSLARQPERVMSTKIASNVTYRVAKVPIAYRLRLTPA